MGTYLLQAEITRAIPLGIELNRAVAVSRAHGPQVGLTLPSLARHLLPSVRADLLYKVGRAAALTRNNRERGLLLSRAASCETDPSNSSDK